MTPTPNRAEQLRQAEIAVAQEMARRAAAVSFREFLHYWHFKNRETGVVKTFLPCLHADPGHQEHEAEIWEGQDAFVEAMAQHPRLYALKAGKLGFTELECAFDAWVALFRQANARIHVFSKGDLASQDVLAYVRFGLTHLPAFLRPTLLARPTQVTQDIKTRGDTMHQLSFEGKDGPDDVRAIVSYPAGANVSVDQTCQHAHVDELARMPFPKQTWQAVHSTIAPGGSCHIVTRGAGEDNHAAELWTQIEDGSGEMYPFFQPYTARPGRDAAWREKEAMSMTTQGIAHFAPETVADALAGDEQSEFIPAALWDACQEELPSFHHDHAGLKGTRQYVVLGVDAGVTDDCFAIVAVTRHPHPARNKTDVAIRAVKVWRPPKGGRVTFEEPEKFIREICRLYNVAMVTYDKHQLEGMMQALRRDGIHCEEFSQQAPRLVSDAALRKLIINRRLAHTGDPDLREHVLNAAAKLQPREDSQLRIQKKAPHRKVDLAVAMSMACDRCLYLLLDQRLPARQ